MKMLSVNDFTKEDNPLWAQRMISMEQTGAESLTPKHKQINKIRNLLSHPKFPILGCA
jgi:hypothetical protein